MAEGTRYQGFVPGRHPLEAYGNGGFRFAGMSHRGSLLALPSGIAAWPVADVAGLNAEAFASVFAEAADIRTFLIGTGTEPFALPQPLRDAFREHGIGVEAMQTGAAARTYNILLGEDRPVGAALIAVP